MPRQRVLCDVTDTPEDVRVTCRKCGLCALGNDASQAFLSLRLNCPGSETNWYVNAAGGDANDDTLEGDSD
jgi:hypothetical protein